MQPSNNRFAAKVWYGPKDHAQYSPNFDTYNQARRWITIQPKTKGRGRRRSIVLKDGYNYETIESY